MPFYTLKGTVFCGSPNIHIHITVVAVLVVVTFDIAAVVTVSLFVARGCANDLDLIHCGL